MACSPTSASSTSTTSLAVPPETPAPSLPNPWLDNPAPTAPWLETCTYTPKHFKDSQQCCHNHYPFPYRKDPENQNLIHFYELRGYGRPSMDVGYPGNIYLDLTPNPYFIYVRYENEWKLWNWSGTNPHQHSFPLAVHPILRDRFLWGGPKGLSWYTDNGLNKREIVFTGRGTAMKCHNPQSMIAAMIHNDPFHPSEEQCALMELEKKKRKAQLNTMQAENTSAKALLVQVQQHATNGLNHADVGNSIAQHAAVSCSNNRLNVIESGPHNTDREESLYTREIKTIHKSLKRMLEQDEKDGNASAAIEKRCRISAEEELHHVKFSLETQIKKLQTEHQKSNEMVKMYKLDLETAQKEREQVEKQLNIVEGTIRKLLKAD